MNNDVDTVGTVRLGMLRNGAIQTNGNSVDTGTGDERVGSEGSMRNAHVGRGDFVNWYDDLGISATQPGAAAIRKDEADYNKKIADYQGQVDSAKGQVNAAYGQLNEQQGQVNEAMSGIPALDDAVNKAWGDYQSGLTAVRVMGPGDKIEATYMVPKEVAQKFDHQPGFYTAWFDDGKEMNVMGKDYHNKEVHTPLLEASTSLEEQYKTKATESIASQMGIAYGQIGDAQNQLNDARGNIDSYDSQVAQSEGMLKGAKNAHQAKWDEVHGKYNKKINTMDDLLNHILVS